jgi:hypothetical protein
MENFNYLYRYFKIFNENCLKTGIDKSCQNSSYFYCNQSMKCIPYHRVNDGNNDCYFKEDELFNMNELFIYAQKMVTLVPFPNLCNNAINGYLLSPGTNETNDETNCDWWPCNNPYTQCDRIWHCLNGADELNCPDTKCSYNEHQCQNEEQFGLSYCISLADIYDKYLDYCNHTSQYRLVYFYTKSQLLGRPPISWNISKCISSDELCRIDKTSLTEKEVCLYQSTSSNSTDMESVKFFQNNEYTGCTKSFATFFVLHVSLFRSVTKR